MGCTVRTLAASSPFPPMRRPALLLLPALALASCGPQVSEGDQYQEAATGQRFEIAQVSDDCAALVTMAQQQTKVTREQNRAGNAPISELQTDTGAGGPCAYYLIEADGRRVHHVRSVATLSSNRFQRLSP